MSHQTVLKIKKASFQAGNKPIKSKKYGTAGPSDEFMPGGYIVGMGEGIDATLSVQPGFKIVTESFVDAQGYQALRIRSVKV